MQERKLIITGDYIDEVTGKRFLEDTRGNLYCDMEHSMHMPTASGVEVTISGIEITCNCSPEVIVTVDLAPEKDKQIYHLLQENAWLWGIIAKAFRDRKEKNCNYAMNKLEEAVEERN